MHFTAVDQREPILRFIHAQVKQLRAELKAAEASTPSAESQTPLQAASSQLAQTDVSAHASGVNRGWKAMADKQVRKAADAGVACGDKDIPPLALSNSSGRMHSRQEDSDAQKRQVHISAPFQQSFPSKECCPAVMSNANPACSPDQCTLPGGNAACSAQNTAKDIDQVCSEIGGGRAPCRVTHVSTETIADTLFLQIWDMLRLLPRSCSSACQQSD